MYRLTKPFYRGSFSFLVNLLLIYLADTFRLENNIENITKFTQRRYFNHSFENIVHNYGILTINLNNYYNNN